AGAHRTVSDHADDVVRLLLLIARDGKAEAGGNRGGGMRRAETVVDALAALGETGKPAALPQRADAVAPPGDDLVRIGLMADIPDQFVAGGLEHVMTGNRQFANSQPRTEVASGHRHRRDRLLTKLVGELAQLRARKLSQIIGFVNPV